MIKNFLVKEGVALSVSSIQGRVAVEGHRESIVNMVASRSVRKVPEEKARELLSQVEVKVETEENAIRIATIPLRTPSRTLLEFPVPRVDYLLAVPYQSSVNIETVSGDIRVTHLQNGVDARTISGNIVAQGLSGASNLESVSGAISVERLLRNLSVQTVSGDVKVDIPWNREFLEIQISSVSGEICIFAHEKEGIELSVETVSGRFHSEIPLEIKEESSPGWRIVQGRTTTVPRKKILVKTTSGDVLIKKR